MTKKERRLSEVYVLGNPSFEKDSLPANLLPRLKQIFPEINFQHLDPTENFPEEENLILIDTIVGIDKVRVLLLEDLDKVELSPRNSVHDFDLGFQLKLMKKLGKLKNIKIIGIPADKNKEEVLKQTIKIIGII